MVAVPTHAESPFVCIFMLFTGMHCCNSIFCTGSSYYAQTLHANGGNKTCHNFKKLHAFINYIEMRSIKSI